MDNTPRSPIPLDTFANRLLLVRAHVGNLTIKEAAARCGLNYGSWSNWERGSRPHDVIDVVDRISEALGIDPHWLMFGGALEQEERRGKRWTARKIVRHESAGEGSQTTVPNLRMDDRPVEPPKRPVPERPRDNRPTGRSARSAPSPATRRPVRI